MEPVILAAIDTLIVCTAFLASALWFRASRRKVRRIRRNEELDYHDFNRIITAMNRTQILNAQAALATAATTILASISLAARSL